MEKILDASLIQKLERLKVKVRRDFASNLKGERRSKSRGGSIEFADYRSYQAGDDFRYLDWNIYARLDKLFLKLFLDDQSLRVDIIIDASKSMEFGYPSKFRYAKQLAAALAYISVLNLDLTSIVAAFQNSVKISPTIRTKVEIPKLINFLSQIEPGLKTDLTKSVILYSQMSPKANLVFLISDFLTPEGYEGALRKLRYGGFDLKAIHLICEDEVDPKMRGDLKLEDVETLDSKEVTLTESKVYSYRNRFSDFLNEIENFCLFRDISYARVSTGLPLENFILKGMRKKGMIS